MSREAAAEVLAELAGRGFPEVEVLAKRGRTRAFRLGPGGEVTSLGREEGWAVRAGDDRRSFCYAATGTPSPAVAWPEADGAGLRLPTPRPVPRWTPPSDLDAPLLGENEARALLDDLARRLDGELPGARLTAAALDDGSSESVLLSSRGADAVVRQRAAALVLEARARGTRRVTMAVAEREARRFHAPALARRLADLLLVADKGDAPRRDRGEVLLAPPLAAALVAALVDLWVGPAARERAAAIAGRGRLASAAFSLVDDGRLPGGLLEAPVDGEGQPTRAVSIVEAGVYRQPLLAWFEERPRLGKASGCVRRPGWRDLPTPGPTHLSVAPEAESSVASLLGAVSRGYYLLAADAAVRIEGRFERFAVPVSGFAVESGRPAAPVSGGWLHGSVSALLGGVAAVGRDRTFFPLAGGLVGSPTLLVRGLELSGLP